MKTPLYRAQQFITTFMKYVNDEFEEAWIAPKQPMETAPDPDALSFYKESQKERDIFREFHREHSTSTSAGSPY